LRYLCKNFARAFAVSWPECSITPLKQSNGSKEVLNSGRAVLTTTALQGQF